MKVLGPSLSRALLNALVFDDFSDAELNALQDVLTREKGTRSTRVLQGGQYVKPNQNAVDTYNGGERIYAIKMYREQTGCGLVYAKQVMEYHCENRLPLPL